MNFGMLRTESYLIRWAKTHQHPRYPLHHHTSQTPFSRLSTAPRSFQKHHRHNPNWLHRHHKFFVQCTLKTPADTCKAQTPWDWEWYPWSQSSNAVCQKPRLLPGSGNFKFKNVLLFEKKNLLLFKNSELNKAGTNSDCRKFGGGGAIVWQKLRLRKISFQIFWRLVNTSFNLSECVSRPVFETDSNCNAASSCSQNP